MIGMQEAMAKGWIEGAGVVEVVKGSPAEKAGIEVGDIITKIDGQKILEKEGGLATIISKKIIGDRLEITVWRNEKEQNLKVTLEEFSE